MSLFMGKGHFLSSTGLSHNAYGCIFSPAFPKIGNNKQCHRTGEWPTQETYSRMLGRQ